MSKTLPSVLAWPSRWNVSLVFVGGMVYEDIVARVHTVSYSILQYALFTACLYVSTVVWRVMWLGIKASRQIDKGAAR